MSEKTVKMVLTSISVLFLINTFFIGGANAVTFDAKSTCTQSLTTFCAVTVGSHSNSILIAHIHSGSNLTSSTSSPTNVKYNGVSMTKLTNKTGIGSAIKTTQDVYYLINPSSGTHNVTFSWTRNPLYSFVGIISLYNIDTSNPIVNTNSSSGTNPTTIRMGVTDTLTSSVLFAGTESVEGATAPNHGALWTNIADNHGQLMNSAQNFTSPSVGGNTFTWASAPSLLYGYSSIGYEVHSFIPPSTPTLTHANTLNSTAIKLDWSAVTGATYYLVNYTSPNGGTFSQIANQSAITLTKNSLTAGTQYVFKVAAGNATGVSAFSNIKSNYTKNIAPTSLTFSLITKNAARVSWANPTGNFSGFKVEYSANGGTSYATAVSNTGNSTNRYDLSSLLSNVLYTVRASTNYGTGSNYSGTSSPSATNTFTTISTAPTSVVAKTKSVSRIDTSWTAPTGNATITGYKVEMSPNNSTWTTISANTGNNTVTYSVTSLPSNVKDYFRISAINSGGTSIPSNIPANTTLASTSSSLLTSSVTTNSIHLSWTAPTGNATITGYKIQYSANGGTSYVTASANTGNSTTHYDFTGLSPNILHTLQISAINAGGIGTATTTTQVTVPTAPTGLLISSVTTTGMRLSWTDSGNGTITGHKLEYSANGGTSYVTASANTGNSTTHYDFTGLSPNVLYTLRVSTINAGGTSSTSTTTQTTISNAPSGLLFSGTTQTSTILSWTAPNGNATISGYEIDKSIDNGVTYSTVSANTGNSTVSYTVTGLTASTTYYFKVEAINAGGTSASLTPSSVTTLAVPTPTPTPTASEGGGSGVGGPVTPLQLTPIVPAVSQGITFTASNDVIMPNQIKNETVTITWPSGETLNVNTIQFGATSLQTKLANTPPYGLTGNAYGTSTAIITYILQVPQQCDGTVTTNCIDITIPTMNLPISFDVTLNGTETSQTVTPQFNIQQETQLPLPLIVIGVSFVAAAYLILRYKLRTSKLDPKKHFKTTKVKEQRLDKPKKKR